MFQVRFPGCKYSTHHGTNTTKKTLCELRNNNFLKIIDELNYPCNDYTMWGREHTLIYSYGDTPFPAVHPDRYKQQTFKNGGVVAV